MGHHLLVYNNSAAGVNDVDVDMTAAVDTVIIARNNHYIFTEGYRLAQAWAVGASMIRARLECPTWNAIGEIDIMTVNRALEPPANPQCDTFWPMGLKIPLNEEVQALDSNNLGTSTEIESVGLQIITDDWSPNIPAGRFTFITRFTGTTTWTLNKWSGALSLTLPTALRGGVYAVIGAQLQADDASFFRLIFPRYRLYNGRSLRPGNIVQNAVGNALPSLTDPWGTNFGEWGRFHTFELPQLEVFGTAADSTAWTLFLKLVYLGEDQSLLGQGLGGGGVTI